VIIEEDVALEHFGVKGMHWGVRKSTSGGTTKKAAASPKKSAAKKPGMTEAEALARHAQRVKLGKEITIATIVAAGGVAVSAVAGPPAGAAVAGVVRAIVAHHQNTQAELARITRDANEIIRDGNATNARLEGLHAQVQKLR